MPEISERERKERKKQRTNANGNGRPKRQVEHFITRITPLEKARLEEMSRAKGMSMSEFVRLTLGLTWKHYEKSKK